MERRLLADPGPDIVRIDRLRALSGVVVVGGCSYKMCNLTAFACTMTCE